MTVNRMDTIAQKATASLTQWPWVLVLLVLGGALLYIAYRYHYDKNLNAALLDKAVRKLPSPKTVLFAYAILAACLFSHGTHSQMTRNKGAVSRRKAILT